jgi:hypothetical protein
MITYDYKQAGVNFDALLNTALKEDMVITKSDGRIFKLISLRRISKKSSFDIDGLNTDYHSGNT